MNVTYVVLAYGNQNLLTKCLQTFRIFHPDDPLIVCDNGGPDGDLTKLLAEKFNGKYVLNPGNESLSKLMNMGVAASETDYVCIVTHGVEFTTRLTETFEKDFAKDEKIACVGGLLMYSDGRIQHGGGRRFWNYGAMGHYGQGRYPHQAKLCLIPAYRLYVTGATAAIRKSFWKDHPYDETLLCSAEDTDLCFKAWQNGMRVFYDPEITSIHNEGATRGRTFEEKQAKSPLMLEREIKTLAIFNARYSDADCLKIDNEVNRLNAELHPKLPKGFVRNGATGDVLRTLRAYDGLNEPMVVITQIPEAFRNRDCVAITNSEEEYAVSSFINMDMAYERRRDLSMEQAFSGVAFGKEDIKNQPIELKSGAVDWFSVKAAYPEFDWDKPYITIHYGAGWPGKVLDGAFWGALTHRFLGAGFRIIAVGSAGDNAPQHGRVLNMLGKTNLHMLRGVFKRSRLFIGNDSAPLHIADGVVPAIGFFMLAPPDRIVSDQVTAFMSPAECAGCQLRRPLATDYQCQHPDGNPLQFHCSKLFDPEEVFKKAMEIIRK